MNRSERRRLARLQRRQGGARGEDAGPMLAAAVGHLQAGRAHEALRLCRRALGVRPTDAEALNLAGVAAFHAGDPGRALLYLEKAVAAAPDHVDAHMNRGNVLKARGAIAEAEAAYRRAIAISPEHADAHFNLGAVLELLARPDAAAEAYGRAAALRPDFADAHLGRANALKALGRLTEAEESYRRSLELAPGNAGAHINLGALLREAGRPAEAEAACRRAAELSPGEAEAHYNLGIALQDQERLTEAEAAYGRAAALAPDHAAAHVNRGYALQRLGRLDEARAAYRRAVALAPDYPGAHVNLAEAHLEAGEARAALGVCDTYLAAHPGDTALLAFRAVVLNELGEERALARLLDFDRFLRPVRFDRAPGFAHMDAFNRALAEHVRAHPTLVEAPASHATREGRHSGELLVEPKGPVAALEAMIGEAVEAYRAALDAEDPDHPFVAARPARYDLSVWGVVLTGAGHQIPHIHPAAWLSGVYYARVPDAVADPGAGEAGWIEFGRPPEHFHCRAPAPTRSFRPEEGLMLLFPSYFYHRTVPFAGTEERVSVAFDVRPID